MNLKSLQKMHNIYKLEQSASELWYAIHDLSAGEYDDRELTEREMHALAELLEGADELVSQRKYILKLIN